MKYEKGDEVVPINKTTGMSFDEFKGRHPDNKDYTPMIVVDTKDNNPIIMTRVNGCYWEFRKSDVIPYVKPPEQEQTVPEVHIKGCIHATHPGNGSKTLYYLVVNKVGRIRISKKQAALLKIIGGER